MIFMKILGVIALLCSIAWFISNPGYESALAVIGSIATLVTLFLVQKRNIQRIKQHQSISESSLGLQAGGDVIIGDIGDDKNAK